MRVRAGAVLDEPGQGLSGFLAGGQQDLPGRGASGLCRDGGQERRQQYGPVGEGLFRTVDEQDPGTG